MTDTYFKIDGDFLPAADCSWVRLAPCGCITGVSLAKYFPSEEEAWKGFCPTVAKRRWEKSRGVTVEIRQGGVMPDMDCPHTPKWGVALRPALPDHTWAGTPHGRRLHLVDVVIGPEGGIYSATVITPVCGRTGKRSWTTKRHRTEGLAECLECLRIASKDVVS